MTDYQAPLRDMRFVMYEVFDISKTWAQWPDTKGLIDPTTADAILEESARLASQVLAPINRSGDEEGCQWDSGSVTTPTGFKAAYDQFAQGGWVSLSGNPDYGGMGMPKVLSAQFDEMQCSANPSFILYPSLTSGACLAIDAHASDQLKATYLPNLYSGKWAATMCLTEAHAGTDLGMIRTKATENGDGSYAITGTKIFITGGEHDLTENIIHLVLAKLPEAPAGPKGISIFLVPKIHVNDDGSLGKRNGVTSGSIEHKMGIKASATSVMNFDGATGYLIGEVNKGLNIMFTMMNYERLLVGVQGLGSSEMSYQVALAYAKDRRQGRAATGIIDKDQPADSLMVHGDVRRMLLNMKALNEAGRAFSTYVAQQLDIVRFSESEEEKQKASALSALLTPVVKAFLTDMGFESCVTGQQVLGGHGYIREWGQEQRVRDVRITQIYEGTNGIQALDLLGRKIIANEGAFFHVFITEVRSSMDKSDDFAQPLLSAVDQLEALTQDILAKADNNPNVVNSACMDYLHSLGYIAYGWMWALMVKTARHAIASGNTDPMYQAKLVTGRYYFRRLLPKASALMASAGSGTEELFNLTEKDF